MFRAVVMTALIAGVLMLFGGVAHAQTGSNPSSYPPSGGTGVLDFGAQRPGGSFNKQDCGFAPGSAASVALNGSAPLFTKQAESDGCVRLTVEIQNNNKIRIDGRNYDANRCAENTITVSGSHRNGGTLSFDNRFRIDCAGVGGTGQGVGGENTARTGIDADDLSLLGAGLVTAGVVLYVIARRRRAGDIDAPAAA